MFLQLPASNINFKVISKLESDITGEPSLTMSPTQTSSTNAALQQNAMAVPTRNVKLVITPLGGFIALPQLQMVAVPNSNMAVKNTNVNFRVTSNIAPASKSSQTSTVVTSHARVTTEVESVSLPANTIYRCTYCNQIFDLGNKYFDHLAEHACKRCGKMFNADDLKKHIETHSPQSASADKKTRKKVHCPICSKQFVHIDYLKKHMVIHSDEKPHLCDLCPKAFRRKYSLTLHRKCHYKEKRFECDICSRKVKSQIQLELHKNRHLKKYTLFCSVCNGGFYKLQELKRHVLKEHENVVYRCEICGKPLRDENYLKLHMKIHMYNYNTSKDHKCHICNKAYHSKSTLTRHLKDHAGGKTLYVCDICGKALSSKNILEEHLIVHQGLKPQKCEVCGKCFAKSNNLRVHMRSHTGVKPYRCELCGKSFSQRPSLVIHMRYHTGEKPYACVICSNAFVSRNLLNVHKKNKHQLISSQ